MRLVIGAGPGRGQATGPGNALRARLASLAPAPGTGAWPWASRPPGAVLPPGGRRAAARPQPCGQDLARTLVRAPADLAKRAVQHPARDLGRRDGHTGQAGVQQVGDSAAAEPGDAKVAADPQPGLGGDPVDHRREPVA
ncbi:MAG TPA: hypothetical protein VGG25_02520, partial [Streptosporangiaceae bacterium]